MTMKILFILNDPPYGTERCYNGLRLANSLSKNDPGTEVTLFLIADAVACAKQCQKTPNGYYNLERMLKRFASGAHKLFCAALAWTRAGSRMRSFSTVHGFALWTNSQEQPLRRIR